MVIGFRIKRFLKFLSPFFFCLSKVIDISVQYGLALTVHVLKHFPRYECNLFFIQFGMNRQ